MNKKQYKNFIDNKISSINETTRKLICFNYEYLSIIDDVASFGFSPDFEKLNIKTNCTSIIFYKSKLLFSEMLNNIVIDNNISAQTIGRIIMENHYILACLIKNDDIVSQTHFNWLIKKKSDFSQIEPIASIITKEEQKKIENNLYRLKNDISFHFYKSHYKDLSESKKKKIDRIAGNEYGWLYSLKETKVDDNFSLKYLINLYGTNHDYDVFRQLSSATHNSDVFQAFLNIDEDDSKLYYLYGIYLDYCKKYLLLFLKQYENEIKDKKKINNLISKIDYLVNELVSKI